jgi:hypothetical protein
MCKKSGKILHHLLLLCEVARYLCMSINLQSFCDIVGSTSADDEVLDLLKMSDQKILQ